MFECGIPRSVSDRYTEGVTRAFEMSTGQEAIELPATPKTSGLLENHQEKIATVARLVSVRNQRKTMR